MLGSDDMKALAEDIRINGLQQPVTLHKGQVLDGRNRMVACVIAGVDPRFTEFKENGVSATQWVISQNLHRRHLTVGQRTKIAVEALTQLEAEAKERQGERNDISANLRGSDGRKAAEQAADLVGVSARSVETAKKLKNDDPEEFEAMASGKKTLNKAVTDAKEKQFRSPFADGLEKGIPIFEQLGMTEVEFKAGMKIRPVFEELADKVSVCAAEDVVNGSTPEQKERLTSAVEILDEYISELKARL